MSSDAHHGGSSEQGSLDGVPTEQYELLRHPRRVHLLDILTDRSQPSLSELTSELIDRETPDTSNSDGAARHEIRLSLVHNHLPRLEDYGLVSWGENEDVIELVDEPDLCPVALSSLLETDAATDASELLERVVHPARLELLETVDASDEAQSLDRLASTLATRERTLPSEPHQAKIALHHSHLPALDDVGVLEYDSDSRLVAPTPETGSVSLVR